MGLATPLMMAIRTHKTECVHALLQSNDAGFALTDKEIEYHCNESQKTNDDKLKTEKKYCLDAIGHARDRGFWDLAERLILYKLGLFYFIYFILCFFCVFCCVYL